MRIYSFRHHKYFMRRLYNLKSNWLHLSTQPNTKTNFKVIPSLKLNKKRRISLFWAWKRVHRKQMRYKMAFRSSKFNLIEIYLSTCTLNLELDGKIQYIFCYKYFNFETYFVHWISFFTVRLSFVFLTRCVFNFPATFYIIVATFSM